MVENGVVAVVVAAVVAAVSFDINAVVVAVLCCCCCFTADAIVAVMYYNMVQCLCTFKILSKNTPLQCCLFNIYEYSNLFKFIIS